MGIKTTIRTSAIIAALALAACGGDDNNDKNGTNNGTAGTNNGTAGTNNGATNNGATNNGVTNNDVTNNGVTNNGVTNNGTSGTNNGTTPDLCLDVDCTAPEASCEGDTAVTYSGDGTCDETDGTCNFDAVKTETDCTATGQICELGACIDADPTPVAGALVISEVMYNPRAVSDNVGEWIELHNTTTRTLDLQGLKFVDDIAAPAKSFELPSGTPIEVPAGGYYVVGVSDDVTANGGAPVDFAFMPGAFNLAQGGTTIIVTDAAGTEIDTVAYDRDMGWPEVNGASLQFGSDFDAAVDDNNDPSFWCASRSAFGDGDFGTPGAANGDCAPVDATIVALQDDGDPNHPELNRVVNITGVAVTATDGADYLWVQDLAGGPNSGLYVDAGNVDTSVLAVGDVVDLTGTYTEFFADATTGDGLTGIVLASVTDTGVDAVIAPEVLEVSDLAANYEQWESVLVQIQEAGVTDDNLGFGEILMDSTVRVDDLLYSDFSAAAADCQIYESITGVLNFSFDNFKIEPRDANDIGAVAVATPANSVTAVNISFTPADICITPGTSVTWTNGDTVAHTVTSRLATDDNAATNIPAAPLLDLSIPTLASSASFLFNEAGTFHYRCRPHPNMLGRVVVTDP